MDHPRTGTDAPPRTPAPSPFHAKGLMYRGALDFYEDYLPGGLETLREALDPQLATFFLGEPFLASSWYDVLPIGPISEAAARLKGVPHPELVRANAAWIAKRDMNGVYRFILKLASPGLVVGRLGRLSMQYFDFGSAEDQPEGEGRHVTVRRGIPAALGDWMVWVTQGFTPVVLEAAGAQEVKVSVEERGPDARFEGQPTVQIRFALEWH